LNLITRNDSLLNASVILFGKKPRLFFPNAKLRCAVFETIDTVTPLDMKDFEGDLFYLIDQAEKYVLQNIRKGTKNNFQGSWAVMWKGVTGLIVNVAKGRKEVYFSDLPEYCVNNLSALM